MVLLIARLRGEQHINTTTSTSKRYLGDMSVLFASGISPSYYYNYHIITITILLQLPYYVHTTYIKLHFLVPTKKRKKRTRGPFSLHLPVEPYQQLTIQPHLPRRNKQCMFVSSAASSTYIYTTISTQISVRCPQTTAIGRSGRRSHAGMLKLNQATDTERPPPTKTAA